MTGPYIVKVEFYSLETGEIGKTMGTAFTSRHTSPHGAGRRLASLIIGRTKLARAVKCAIPRGRAGRFFIVDGNGASHPLNAHRRLYCAPRT